MAVSYLRSKLQPALWTERTKYCSQTSHLVRPLQGFLLQDPLDLVGWPKRSRKPGKKKKKRKTYSYLHLKLSDKTASSLPHKAQNNKHQYQDWTPKE
jgi:hypothetical protein